MCTKPIYRGGFANTHKALYTHTYIHFGLFSYRNGGLVSQNPLFIGPCEGLRTFEGLYKALFRELCKHLVALYTHTYTHFCLFPTHTGGASWRPLLIGMWAPFTKQSFPMLHEISRSSHKSNVCQTPTPHRERVGYIYQKKYFLLGIEWNVQISTEVMSAKGHLSWESGGDGQFMKTVFYKSSEMSRSAQKGNVCQASPSWWVRVG